MPAFATIAIVDEGGERTPDAVRLAEQLRRPDLKVTLLDKGRRSLTQLLRVAHGPVAFAPDGYALEAPDELRVISVGFDGEAESGAALRLAEQLALAHDATMRVYAALPRYDWSAAGHAPTGDEFRRGVRDSLDARLRQVVETLDPSVRAAARAVRGDPVGVLATASREGPDLLVVGSHCRGPLERLLLGSVSTDLRDRAECPLLVVPPAETGQAAA